MDLGLHNFVQDRHKVLDVGIGVGSQYVVQIEPLSFQPMYFDPVERRLLRRVRLLLNVQIGLMTLWLWHELRLRIFFNFVRYLNQANHSMSKFLPNILPRIILHFGFG